MVKANTIIAAFSLILLIFMASIVYAGDGGGADATPRATVSLSQIEFSKAKTKSAQTASINTVNSSAAKNTGAGDGGKQAVAENTASGDGSPPSEPADAETITGLSVDRGGESTVTAEGNNDAAAAAAPVFLGSADDTCMGSSAGGGQGTGFGFSLGSTWTDENCKMLKNARELKSHGHHAAAKARLCMDNDNALAFELAGEPCPRALPSAQAAIETIRERNPGYRAAADHGFQVAALTHVTGRDGRPSAESRNFKNISSLDSTGEETDAASKFGTLLAMVMSAVNHVASTVSVGFDIDVDSMSAMDGIE